MTRDPAAKGIYKRGSVYWLAQQRNHKRVFVSLETTSLSEAIEKAALIRDAPELNQGGLMAAEVERFIAYKKEEKQFSRHSCVNVHYALKPFVERFSGLSPGQITAAQATSYMNYVRGRDLTDATKETYIGNIRAFFTWCVNEAKSARTNPFAGLKMPNVRSAARREFCLPALRDKLLNECHRDDLRFILFCGFHAGMRRNEIIEARPDWFDLENRLLTIRKITPADAKRRGLDPFDLKDGEERSIPISAAFTEFLQRWLDPSADYCIGPGVRRGKSRYRFDFIGYFMKYMKQQGCRWVTPHTMRRTFASIQVSKGRSIYLVSKWLGDDVNTTARHYAHLMPAHDELEQGL